jgi:hypothetical protein
MKHVKPNAVLASFNRLLEMQRRIKERERALPLEVFPPIPASLDDEMARVLADQSRPPRKGSAG